MIPISEAAKELKVTPRQLLRWVQKNRIFVFIYPDWNILIPRREVERIKLTPGNNQKADRFLL
jgi:hypothetical protein